MVDGVPQGKGQKDQGHAEGDAEDAGKHAHLVAEGVADDVLLVEAQAAPQERKPLQQDGLGALGGLGAHALGGSLLQQRAGHQPGAADTAQGGEAQGLSPGGIVVAHRVGRQVAPHGHGIDNEGAHIPARPGADGEAHNHHQDGVEQVVEQDGAVSVAQGLEGADVRAGVLDQAVHGAHHHQHRAQEEQHRENAQDGGQVVPHLHQVGGNGVVLQGQHIDHPVSQGIIHGRPELGAGDAAVGGDADLVVPVGPHKIGEELLCAVGEGVAGEIRSRIGGVDQVHALGILDQPADIQPQLPPGSGDGELVPVPHLEAPGRGQLVADRDLPSAVRQGARHHIGGVDGVVLRNGVELEGDVAVVPLLRVQHDAGLHPGDAGQLRQGAAVTGVQAGSGQPVIRRVLTLQVLFRDAIQVKENTTQGGIDHDGDQGDDAHRDQAGGGAPQIPHKVFPDHATTPVPAPAPGGDSP